MDLLEQYRLLGEMDVQEHCNRVDVPPPSGEPGCIEAVHRIDEPFTVMLWRTVPGAKVIYSYIDKDHVFTSLANWRRAETHLHRHDYIEMLYVIRGEFSQIICGQKQTFPEGTACIIDTNCEHTDIVAGQDNFVIFLCMSEDFFDQLFLAGIDGSPLQQFITRALMSRKNEKQFIRFKPKDGTQSLLRLLAQVAGEKAEHRAGSDYIIKGLMMRIFDTLIREYETDLTQMQRQRMNELLFHEVETYLRRHYMDVTIDDLVRTSFPKGLFQPADPQTHGAHYSDFLHRIRLARAKEMLLHTTMPVKKIIQAVGYENAHYFYTVFQKTHGMTPGEYRAARTH